MPRYEEVHCSEEATCSLCQSDVTEKLECLLLPLAEDEESDGMETCPLEWAVRKI
jgi:hypothetical protein